MIEGKTISLIMPAYNEADVIEETLKALDINYLDEIIVVNDGSTDNTLAILQKYPVKVVNLNNNQGKGKAVFQGLKKAQGEIIVLVDADLGASVKEIKKLIIPVIKGEADTTIAIIEIKGGGTGLVRSLADLGLRLITGQKMEAPLSGQRVFKREVLDYIIPLVPSFGLEIGMNIDLLRNNIKIKEIECEMTHRVTGKNLRGFMHRAKQFLAILNTLWLKRRKNERVVKKI